MSIRTNSLPSFTVQLLRHFWSPGALSIWLSSTFINSLAVQHAFFGIYIDDMLTGADTFDELKLIRDETIQLLKLRAFELSKWASNCPELLEINNRDRVPEIMLRIHVFWAYSARIHSNFSANLIKKLTLYQNGSYFPKSLNCSILWAFWIRSL